MQFLKPDWIVQYGLPRPLQNSWVPKVKLNFCWMCDYKKPLASLSQPCQIGFGLDASGEYPKYPKLRKDKNFFFSFMKMSDKVLWSCAGAPGVRIQVLPLIVLIHETLIPWSHYCQCWLLQLQTLHLHSRMKGKRRERTLFKRCVEMSWGHFPEVVHSTSDYLPWFAG